jgi:hypothetical protein
MNLFPVTAVFSRWVTGNVQGRSAVWRVSEKHEDMRQPPCWNGQLEDCEALIRLPGSLWVWGNPAQNRDFCPSFAPVVIR